MTATDQHGPAEGEARARDQRATPRSSLMLRTAKVVCQSGEYVCIVRDVSSDGVGLRFLHSAPSEDRILLELANGATYPVERVWAGKRQSGFRFAASIDLEEFIHEPSPYRARPIRLRITADAELTCGNRSEPARLVDLSCGGAMIDSAMEAAVGGILRLEIGTHLSKLAEVCWTEAGCLGLSFLQPMKIEELATTVLALQPFDGIRAAPIDDDASTIRAA